MAEIKWIKVMTDIFEHRKIRQIENLPESDSILVIWFKLLCLAGTLNNDGTLRFTDAIPYNQEMLSTEFKRPVEIIRKAIDLFSSFGMIHENNGILQISNWDKYQNIEGLDRIRTQTRTRVQRYRENQRALMLNKECQYCGSEATGYDHVIALSRGGMDHQDNRVECCKECNQIKNDKPIVDFLNMNRDRINDEIVCANPILKRMVTLSNVTNRYEVTLRNATDKNRIDKNRLDKSENISSIPTLSPAKPTRKKPAQKIDLSIIQDDLLREAMTGFVEFRETIRKPMTQRAVELALKELNKLSPVVDVQIEIIQQSILRGWSGLFKLSEDYQRNPRKSELERLMEL